MPPTVPSPVVRRQGSASQLRSVTPTGGPGPERSILSPTLSSSFSPTQPSQASPTQPSPLNPNWSAGRPASPYGGGGGVTRSGSGGSRESSSEESAGQTTRTSGEAAAFAGQGQGQGGAGAFHSAVQRRPRDGVTQGVATNTIGSAYGPYSYQSIPTAVSQQPLLAQGASQRFSTALSDTSLSSYNYEPPKRSSGAPSLMGVGPGGATGPTTTMLLWDEKDPEMDDALHRPDPPGKRDGPGFLWSTRGCINMSALFLLVAGLVTLFAGYPIISFYRNHRSGQITGGGFNLGGINGSGQVPMIPNLPSLIDKDTPASAYGRTGFDGKTYNLIFSDEFETDGRTFFPGDDPYWEAVDLHYWPTADFQWYSPRAATTKDGNLVLTMTERPSHGLNFESAMIQSWNKFCFTGGYIEVKISLPGNNIVGGFWPGAWLMGNLGRPGYGATTDGVWPYSYNSCDIGTFPNQTYANGSGPVAALTTGYNDGPLSYLPGQRLSSCTCPGEDHPGPSENVGRGAPEIDILEGQVDVKAKLGQMSQSCQVAPYDAAWQFNEGGTTTFDSSITKWNGYQGGPYQQAVSALTYVDADKAYNGNFETYGVEFYSDKSDPTSGYITWQVDDTPTWTMLASAVGPNAATEVSQRDITVEPMSIVFNFAMSNGFQPPDFKNLVWPAQMLVDYVRVYQPVGQENYGCDPADYPTADYIAKHSDAYTNANLTVWSDTGLLFPRNSLYEGC